jgi:phosphatidylinositol glycan class V
MGAVAALVMHVNVATRFLSSSPLLYWFTATYISREGAGRWRAAWVWLWALAFTALGSVMFPNFYPWT